ncbi:divergent polysaccharide deacetylase family protein [Campylobacter sp. W0018]|uniref:divergent polysaccharide deacetylase family protein n=1 Tax=Campylobacter sp. W0018 TaxID=2735782 RepID=UPI00301CAAFC|nr:divergent polysaccharide deacetylase family protein [Campylobacter sp. W0018]
MLKKKITQIQRFLIIAILFLLCIALALGILLKYQELKNTTNHFAKNNNDQQENLILLEDNNQNKIEMFEDFHDQDKNKSLAILEQEAQKIDNDINLTKMIEQNISLEKNGTLKSNLSLNNDNNLSLKNTTILENNSSLIEQNLSTQTIQKKDKHLPKLAIIIDDMANASQVRNLKALNLKLNPSFFPPDKNHPNTPKLASNFNFYMVHLPLAAIHYNKPELDTLNPNDSEERIFKKIAQIKKDFKNLKYINNHTGSLFTSNEKAMKNLYEALKSQNLLFVDSKTIGNSKALKASKETAMVYIQRDIFLDNEDNVDYVKKQLLSAVRLAQKKGFAIAIGHPRKSTLKALQESKDLLAKVELVYLSEIYGK